MSTPTSPPDLESPWETLPGSPSELEQPIAWMRGFTILEAAVATALAVAVLAFTMGSLNAIGSATRYSEAKLQNAVKTRDALWLLRTELERTSLRPDKRTGGSHCDFQVVAGRTELRYQTVTGANLSTGELGTDWSGDIRLHYDPTRRALIRTEDGRETAFGSNLSDTVIVRTADDRIRIELVSERRMPGTTKLKQERRRLVIRPLY